jgi:hypothetical protein
MKVFGVCEAANISANCALSSRGVIIGYAASALKQKAFEYWAFNFYFLIGGFYASEQFRCFYSE